MPPTYHAQIAYVRAKANIIVNTRLIGKPCYENTSNNCLESRRGTKHYSKFSEMTRATRALSRILGNAFRPVRKTPEYPAAVTPPLSVRFSSRSF